MKTSREFAADPAGRVVECDRRFPPSRSIGAAGGSLRASSATRDAQFNASRPIGIACAARTFGKAHRFAYDARSYAAGLLTMEPANPEGEHMRFTTGVPLLGAFLTACLAAASAEAQTATATLAPTAGNTTAGTVTFTQKGDKVTVNAKLSGLAPGAHGFHVHEKGDCS